MLPNWYAASWILAIGTTALTANSGDNLQLREASKLRNLASSRNIGDDYNLKAILRRDDTSNATTDYDLSHSLVNQPLTSG